MRRCARCSAGKPCNFRHGAQHANSYHGCGCKLCLVGKSRCVRCWQGEPCGFTHGSTGYEYHRCRCDICTVAHRNTARKYRRMYVDTYAAIAARARAKQTDEQRAARTQASQEWHERNPRARAQSSKRKRARDARLPVRRRGPWTPEDRATIMRDDMSMVEIAAMIGRSVVAVTSMRQSIREGRIPVDSPGGHRPYTPDEDAVIMRRDLSRAEKAALIGRSVHSVIHRITYLNRVSSLVQPE